MAYLKDADNFKEGRDRIAVRRERFERLNEEARLYDCWLISVPGAKEIVIETLPGSAWPAVLRKRYKLSPPAPLPGSEPGGERILPAAIREAMTINADGTLSPLSPGSTQPTTFVVHHAGVHKTERFGFNLP